MIIQCKDGSLVSAVDGRRWALSPSTISEGEWIVGLILPPASIEQEHAISIVLGWGESEQAGRAFLDSLARRLGAVKWDSEKRFFEPVGGPNE